MQEDEVLKIAIAETSMIVRSGLALVLKRIQGLKILPIELVSEESLDECVRFHKPEILIVNPSFTGYFDVRKFKETPQNAGVKCIALMCSVADQGVLRNYDESLTIYDDADTIREKLNRLLNVPGEETEEELAGQEVLSSREKEIITCVVKGMTNKEIADAIMSRMGRGVTGLAAKGMYSDETKNMLFCVVSRKEIVEIKEIVSEYDPKAFFTFETEQTHKNLDDPVQFHADIYDKCRQLQDNTGEPSKWNGNQPKKCGINHHAEPCVSTAPQDTLCQHGLQCLKYNDKADRVQELHGNVMCFNGKVVGIDHKRPDDH